MAKRVRHTIGTRRVRVDNAPVAETAQPCGIERTGATGSATRPHRHDHGEGVGYMLVSSVSRVRACARERVVGVRDGAVTRPRRRDDREGVRVPGRHRPAESGVAADRRRIDSSRSLVRPMSDPLRLQQPFGTSALACAQEDQHTLKGADGVAEEGEVVGPRWGGSEPVNRLGLSRGGLPRRLTAGSPPRVPTRTRGRPREGRAVRVPRGRSPTVGRAWRSVRSR